MVLEFISDGQSANSVSFDSSKYKAAEVARLQILAISLGDAGLYTCHLDASGQPSTGYGAHLMVIGELQSLCANTFIERLFTVLLFTLLYFLLLLLFDMKLLHHEQLNAAQIIITLILFIDLGFGILFLFM